MAPITTPNDLRNKKIRINSKDAEILQSEVSAAGAVLISQTSLPAAEVYTALRLGVVQCVAGRS